MFKHFLAILLLPLLISPGVLYSQEDNSQDKKVLVYKFDIKKEIAEPVWRITKKSFDEASSMGADYIIIHMNTYGGLVTSADSIRTRILNCEIPTYVFIDNNAASAGALISIACDRIYMRPGGSIGAATVVNQTGQEVPDKFQSFMRSTMRSTAETHGKDTLIQGNDTILKWYRDPRIAEAMVDASVYIENISDTGKVLTLTADEAIEVGYCEGKAENIEEVLRIAGIESYELKEYVASTSYRSGKFMVNGNLNDIRSYVTEGSRKDGRGRYLGDEFSAPDLRQYMLMSYRSFTANGNFNYGLGALITYYFMHMENDGDRKNINAFLTALNDGKKGEEALKALLAGRSFDELEVEISKAWRSRGVKIKFN